MSLVITATPTNGSTPKGFLVRHGRMRFMGDFTPTDATVYQRFDPVIIKTERGLEHGELLCPATPLAMAAIPEPTSGELVRKQTDADKKQVLELIARQEFEYETSMKMIAQHRLAMQIVDVEHLFGNERIVFYFISESRVDFRELVKSMAREFRARIELRQIGVRDEAKLLADFGDCGKPVCCNSHMIVMPPVSMRMAKLQKASLDPNKISGRCGRLKCCLRFEQDVYEEILAELPPVGSRIITRNGQGRVLAQEILARRLLVEFEDGRRLPIPADDVLSKL